MRELDDLLTHYLDERYPTTGDEDKAAFAALLELPDLDLVGYLLQRQQPDSERIADVVKLILDRDSA